MKGLKVLVLTVLVISFSGLLSNCKPQYRGSKAIEKRKKKLKRKYKRNGINDCPVFDCRNLNSMESESV